MEKTTWKVTQKIHTIYIVIILIIMAWTTAQYEILNHPSTGLIIAGICLHIGWKWEIQTKKKENIIIPKEVT